MTGVVFRYRQIRRHSQVFEILSGMLNLGSDVNNWAYGLMALWPKPRIVLRTVPRPNVLKPRLWSRSDPTALCISPKFISGSLTSVEDLSTTVGEYHMMRLAIRLAFNSRPCSWVAMPKPRPGLALWPWLTIVGLGVKAQIFSFGLEGIGQLAWQPEALTLS